MRYRMNCTIRESDPLKSFTSNHRTAANPYIIVYNRIFPNDRIGANNHIITNNYIIFYYYTRVNGAVIPNFRRILTFRIKIP